MQALNSKKLYLNTFLIIFIIFNLSPICIANPVTDLSGSSEISIENNLPQNSSTSEDSIPAEILLTEVNFKNSEEDFLTFTVKSLDKKAINLRGLEFYDDKTFKTIEQNFFVQSGDQITLFFNLDLPDNSLKKEIYTTRTGLVSTTEQIILKQNQQYFDYLCWQKSPISKTEQLDFQKTFQDKFWDNNNIDSCLESNSIDKNQSVFRQNDAHNSLAWSIEDLSLKTSSQENTDPSIYPTTEYADQYPDDNFETASVKSSNISPAQYTPKTATKKSSTSSLAQEIADLGPDQVSENPEERQIIITEIMPAPLKAAGAKSTPEEWIEIHNQSDQEINLRGWIIDDSDGGSKPHLLDSQIISPDQYLILSSSKTKLNLNNTSDQVRLFDSQKNFIDAVEYQEAEKNSSYARIKVDEITEWHWQKNPTPEAANPNYISISGKITSAPVFEQTYHFQIEAESEDKSPETTLQADSQSASTKQQYEIIFDEQIVKAPLAKNIFTPGTTGKFIGQIIPTSDKSAPQLQLNQYQLDETEVPTNNNSLSTIIVVIILAVGIISYYLIKTK